ncbi:DEAD-box ATP-dependent RNA helicase 21 [Capsicum baccatum]|uniref:DEAD-box ATP-dependent RNA helicase 21 n=1 Tax=Capsicum baccatum TaxID=33114 RepID=A0A2G2XD56_CAPBA|nr:DEAD-box ATP-dependent RNA helicase 21 [Capsicum baccatum]
MRVDCHWSDKKLEDMTERDWRIFKEDHDISYKGSRIPHPMRNWGESKLTRELLKAVKRAGYKKPSPIQMASIPLGLQQRDVIGVAQTGSGKTAAFVLPMLSYITRLPPLSEENGEDGPYAVVLAPTRELAQQIEHQTVKLAHYLGIKVVSIVGGQSIEEQSFRIRQGCEVVIATPGRLLDFLKRRYCVLNQCNYVVLDEADRMIDMGFEPQVVDVLDAMPSSNMKPKNEDEELDEKKIYRTTYMFSATMPLAVERLAGKYLRNHVVVNIGTAGKATDLTTQHVFMVKEPEKMYKLQKLLDRLGNKTAIVFINTKEQEPSEISLEGFRSKRYNVLVATDVASRGIDIPGVAHVINYDMPNNIEAHTHRIGRTGRAGKTGVATTFLTMQDTEVFYDLKQMLTQRNSPFPQNLPGTRLRSLSQERLRVKSLYMVSAERWSHWLGMMELVDTEEDSYIVAVALPLGLPATELYTYCALSFDVYDNNNIPSVIPQRGASTGIFILAVGRASYLVPIGGAFKASSLAFLSTSPIALKLKASLQRNNSICTSFSGLPSYVNR